MLEIKTIRKALDEALKKEEARIKKKYGHPEKCEYSSDSDSPFTRLSDGCKHHVCHEVLYRNFHNGPAKWYSALSDMERYINEAGHDPENFITV